MNEIEFKIKTEMIKEKFKDTRSIECATPDHIRQVDEGIYPGDSVFTTSDGEFIDLEIQIEDFNEEELAKYIEFAENLYEKHHKHISIYIICPKNINVLVKEFTIKSEADFVIKLYCDQGDPCEYFLDNIENKIANNEFISEHELYYVEMLPVWCNKNDRHYFRVESLKIINKLNH